MAVSASFANCFGGAYPKSLKHISQAYKLTNERLSGPEALSDQTIAVVTMFAVYQRIHHLQAHGLIHFEGLRRMIRLRGGLVELAKENRGLAQKPWRYVLLSILDVSSAQNLQASPRVRTPRWVTNWLESMRCTWGNWLATA